MARCDQDGDISVKFIGLVGFACRRWMDAGIGREAAGVRQSRVDLEGFWPGRRLDAFDGLCPEAAPPTLHTYPARPGVPPCP
jgi:hypothetical protein